MAEPFRRKDIAKAFFGLDISDAEPRVRSLRPQAKATVQPKQKCLLLGLPVEIRLQIYELLLVSWFDRRDNPSWSVGDTHQKVIMLDIFIEQKYRTMKPAVLQTCRQIYREAVPILYERNVFSFNEPDLMLRLIAQVGYTNTKMIQSLEIYVPPDADKDSWLNLLRILPQTTTGLKSVTVRWWGTGDQNTLQRSLGKDVAFAQALAGLSTLGVKRLRIEGHYAKPWPAYFRDKFGALAVEVEDGRSSSPEDDDNDWVRQLDRYTLDDFRRYQDGTDLLNPWEEEAGNAGFPNQATYFSL